MATKARETNKQTANYRDYMVYGNDYRVELIKQTSSNTWQYRVYWNTGEGWEMVDHGIHGTRDQAATVAGIAIAEDIDRREGFGEG